MIAVCGRALASHAPTCCGYLHNRGGSVLRRGPTRREYFQKICGAYIKMIPLSVFPQSVYIYDCLYCLLCLLVTNTAIGLSYLCRFKRCSLSLLSLRMCAPVMHRHPGRRRSTGRAARERVGIRSKPNKSDIYSGGQGEKTPL